MTSKSSHLRHWSRLAATAVVALGLWASLPAAPSVHAEQLPSIADTVERLLPSVVDITTSQSIAAREGGGGGAAPPDTSPNAPFRDFFDDFFKNRPRDEAPAPDQPPGPQVTSLGSGFVIDATGYIITNNHVVERAETIEVRFTDGRKLKAKLIGKDTKTDIAVLKVESGVPLSAVKFGDSDKLRVGEWVMAIGNPFGLGGSVSLGIVSARNRDLDAGPYDDFIQTDAAINKGNSGGPLFNLQGDVVGINTAIYSPSGGGSVGIGFSVPAATARGVVDQLIKFGEVRRGWLGVKIQPVTDDLVESLGLDRARGALVADVTATGPAEKAGIEAGDVIVEFDGRAIGEMKDLPRIVGDTEIGRSVTVRVMRQGKELALNAEVGRLEDGEKIAAGGGTDGATVKALGMTLSAITDDLRAKFGIDVAIKGAVVVEVEENGPAAEKRIAPGDVITEAGEKEVTRPSDIEARVRDAEKAKKTSVLLLVSKGGKQGEMSFIAVKLK